MLSIPDTQLEEAAIIIGTGGFDEDEIETKVAALVRHPMLARRLIDVLPEAFGMVLASHIDELHLPRTFKAKNKLGDWIELDLKAEPIFEGGVRLAMHMYHNGPRERFKNIASRSAVIGAVNQALNAGGSIKGAHLAGPSFMGIPAETYTAAPPSRWRKLFR